MGDAYLLPAIAAVVVGGTNILGGRGRYLGTFVRRHTDRSPQFGAIDHADVGSESTDYLWYSHHRDVARLWW
jgi:hypothetical protein